MLGCVTTTRGDAAVPPAPTEGRDFGWVVVYVRRAHAHLAPQSSQTGGALQRGIGRDIDRRRVPRPSVVGRRIRRDVELGLRARGVGNEGTVVRSGRGRGDVHRGLAATQPGTADRDGSGGTRGRSQRRRRRTGRRRGATDGSRRRARAQERRRRTSGHPLWRLQLYLDLILPRPGRDVLYVVLAKGGRAGGRRG